MYSIRSRLPAFMVGDGGLEAVHGYANQLNLEDNEVSTAFDESLLDDTNFEEDKE